MESGGMFTGFCGLIIDITKMKELLWKFTYQTWYSPRLNYQLGWEGQGSKFASKATKKIC